MKYALLIIFLFLTIVSNIFAQQDSSKGVDREITFSGGLSYSSLPSEFREIWTGGIVSPKLSWNAGIGYGYSFAPGSVGYGAVSLTLDYNRYTFNPSGYREYLFAKYVDSDPKQAQEVYTASIAARGSAKIITASVNFKGSFSSTKQTVAPYFLIGLGFSYFSSDSVSLVGAKHVFTVEPAHQSAFTWSAGIGVEAPISECLGIFVQAKSALLVRDPPRQYFPISAGIKVRI